MLAAHLEALSLLEETWRTNERLDRQRQRQRQAVVRPQSAQLPRLLCGDVYLHSGPDALRVEDLEQVTAGRHLKGKRHAMAIEAVARAHMMKCCCTAAVAECRLGAADAGSCC